MADTYVFFMKLGSRGSGNGQFECPLDVAVDSSGNVYVCDTYNHRIQKFDSKGTFLTKWGFLGSGNGQFNPPWSIDVDSSGNVYVVDFYNHRIQKFDSNGIFLTKWGSHGTGDGQFDTLWGIAVDSSGNVYVGDTATYISNTYSRIQKFNSNGIFLTKWGSRGTGDGQFSAPISIIVNSLDNVYVCDTYNPSNSEV